MRNGHRISAIHGFEISETLLKELHRLVIFHIADVLARDGESSFGQRKGIFEISAAAEDFRPVIVKHDRVRRITAGTADETTNSDCGLRISDCDEIPGLSFRIPHSAFRNSNHRIIDPHEDVPVMQQKTINDPGELFDWLHRCPAR